MIRFAQQTQARQDRGQGAEQSLGQPDTQDRARIAAIGQRREKQLITFISDNPKKGEKPVKVSLALDSHGTVSGLHDSDFASPKELGKILAGAPQCQECIVRQLFRYAYGRKESGADRPVIQKGLEIFRSSQFQFKELMVYLAESLAT